MQDIIPDLDQWLSAGERIALATVVDTWGSSPRPVGSKMGITASGGISGSVSAGCVEGAVVEEGQTILRKDGVRLLHYGISDDTAFGVGLMCGGKIEIFVRPLNVDFYPHVRDAVVQGRCAAIASIIAGGSEIIGREWVWIDGEGFLGNANAPLDQIVQTLIEEAVRAGKPRRLEITDPQEATLFIDVMLPAPTLVAVGGVHVSIALVQMARILGYHTVVIDPRRTFASQARFPQVDHMLQVWPDEAFRQHPLTSTSAVAVLTHDPKIDDPALIIALKSPAFYVGALGSKRTQGLRRERMIEAGITPAQLERLHGPIGLNIGAHTSEEIALSILAEVMQIRNS
jgi:xanthine dehydrogenase accessory factor